MFKKIILAEEGEAAELSEDFVKSLGTIEVEVLRVRLLVSHPRTYRTFEDKTISEKSKTVNTAHLMG